MTDANSPLGLIGLGLMGQAWRAYWQTGNKVFGWDVDPSCRRRRRASEGQLLPAPADVFVHCHCVLLSFSAYL